MKHTLNFRNAAELNRAITEARSIAKEEARRDCGRGILASRGAFLRASDAAGNIVAGECDSWAYDATAKGFQDLANLLRYDTKVARITIEGGFNFAASIQDHADGAYDPFVSEWEVEFGINTAE